MEKVSKRRHLFNVYGRSLALLPYTHAQGSILILHKDGGVVNMTSF